MKTKLSPLLTAFDALDLALRVAGVVGGLAAIATHFSARSADAGGSGASTPSAYVAPAEAFRAEAMQARVEAAMARAHATHAGTRVIRIQLNEVPTPPVPPAVVPDGDGD